MGGAHHPVHGDADLTPQTIDVPGDPSSAAFFVVAALLAEGSDLVIENVGLNPTRAGLFEVLRADGRLDRGTERREVGGEPVADLRVKHSALTGIDIDPALAPSMIDEFPVLFVAACAGEGHHHHQRAGRIARQGKRPPDRDGRRAGKRRRAGRGNARTA